jgi:anti-sigma regulatory factor (Ser/Thr protein kinase)
MTGGRLIGSIIFPGLPAQVPMARGYVRQMVAGCPRRDDAMLLVSELVTNAIRYTRSGAGGGVVTLTLLDVGHAVRYEVTDQGGAATRPEPSGVVPFYSEHGRGLCLVEAIADRWAADPCGDGTRTWFELSREAENRLVIGA